MIIKPGLNLPSALVGKMPRSAPLERRLAVQGRAIKAQNAPKTSSAAAVSLMEALSTGEPTNVAVRPQASPGQLRFVAVGTAKPPAPPSIQRPVAQAGAEAAAQVAGTVQGGFQTILACIRKALGA